MGIDTKNWITWSPFQSPDTSEICSHMTPLERMRGARRGAAYGFWVLISVALPVDLAILYHNLDSYLFAAAIIAIHIAMIPVWQRRQKRFLCSTEWALGKGFTPEQLKIFSFKQTPGR